MKGSAKQFAFNAPAVFPVMGLLLQGPRTACSRPLMGQSSSAPDSATEMRVEAFRMADFILSLGETDGAIVDELGGAKVNEDLNMEYALIGIGAAYASSKQDKYLEGLERGIKWLADREEMSDPRWKGSWYFVYSARTGPHLPSSPGPGMTDGRGVDATSALFTYRCTWTGGCHTAAPSRIDTRRTAGPHWISLPARIWTRMI